MNSSIAPVTTGAHRATCTFDSRHTLSAVLPLQVMRKADLIRKNMAESVKNERNILAMANNPFVVGTARRCLPGWHRRLMHCAEATCCALVTWRRQPTSRHLQVLCVPFHAAPAFVVNRGQSPALRGGRGVGSCMAMLACSSAPVLTCLL